MRFLVLLLAIWLAGCANSSKSQSAPIAQSLTPVEQVFPRYPKIAMDRKLSGFVVMTFNVTRQGDVTDLKVKESSPAGIFDREAVRALSQWKFAPSKSEEPTPQELKLEFRL